MHVFICTHNYFFLSFLQAKEIFKIHDSVCPRSRLPGGKDVQISLDGVSETKSTSVSIDVYSVKMRNCKCVYPVCITRPLAKYRGLDSQEQLRIFVDDVKSTDKHISHFLGDNQKRSTALNSLGHASWYPCEYCFARGVPLKTKTADGKNKTKITWPASTAGGEQRTREKIKDILQNIDHLGPKERKGIVGPSVLLDLPNFDIVRDSPCEYLHSTCLGVIKRTVSLTFSVGESRPRVTKRKLSDPAEFNVLMLSIKMPKESSRRARELDFAVLKGAEFRNLAIFFFPLIIECIEEGEEERELWLCLAYMVRACIVPSEEFRYVNLNVVEMCSKKIYQIYEKLFGAVNCTYNSHIVFSHITEIRAHGPLTETSTFSFKSFYGELKNCYVPGTPSPLKQAFQKVLLKRAISHHCCQIPITYSNKETSRQNDTLIYVWKYNQHNMYKIVDFMDDILICHKIIKTECSFEDADLPWTTVGVFEFGEIDETEYIEIDKDEVSGKVLFVKEYLITCPMNILREK